MSEEEFDFTLRDLTPEALNDIDEEQLLNALAARIAELLDKEPGLLFSTLYRLDVLEHKINAVLKTSDDPAMGLAQLILERQKEKLKTRSNWKSDWNFE